MFSVDFRKEFRVKRRKVSSSYAHIYVSLQRLIKVGKVKNISIYSNISSQRKLEEEADKYSNTIDIPKGGSYHHVPPRTLFSI